MRKISIGEVARSMMTGKPVDPHKIHGYRMTEIPALMRSDDIQYTLDELQKMMVGGHNPFISNNLRKRLEMGPMPDEDNWAFKKARDDMKAPAYKKEYVKKKWIMARFQE